MTDAADDLLRELVAEVRGLRADITRRQRRRLFEPDRAALAKLLPIIATAVEYRVFTVRMLVEHAKLPQATALREAIDAVGGAHALGHLLKRSDGCRVAGFVLDSVDGNDRDGRMWRVSGDSHRDHRTDE
jgi:hypothetical protein